MEKFMVIAKINGRDYMVKAEARCALEAEHAVLDEGKCFRNGYGVEGAQAFSAKEMKTEYFVNLMLNTDVNLVSSEELMKLINENNERLAELDAAQERLEAEQKALKELLAQMESLQAAINEQTATVAACKKLYRTLAD